MGMMEYEDEPVEGFPENLPEGEKIIWQGQPRWLPWPSAYFMCHSSRYILVC